jgi:phytoene dehydrogenase-like protein
MHHVMGEHAGAGGWGFVRGGMGAITQAIARSGKEKGLVCKTESAVAAIDTANGRATGVTLADGTRYEADIVASNVSAKLTFLKFLDKSKLPEEFVRDLEAYRTFSTAFKINIACEALPKYTAFDPAACGFAYPTYTHIGPTIEYLELAYDDAKYGDMSREPFVTPVTPTFVDDSVAPPGKHIVNLFGGHAPYTLKTGDWASRKDELVRNVLNVIDAYAPGFSNGIIGMQVLTPPSRRRSALRTATSSTANCRSTSSSGRAPRRTGRTTGRRLRASINAALPLIRAAASAASLAITPPERSLRTGGDEAQL